MSQFPNPSAVAPFRDGYLLLTGMGDGKDGRHGLQFLFAAVDDPSQLPPYKPLEFIDIAAATSKPSAIVTQNGVYDGAVPFLFALTGSLVVAVYPGIENGKFGIWAHIFYDSGEAFQRVCSYQLAVPYSASVANQIAAAMVPGKNGFILMSAGAPDIYWCTVPAYNPGQSIALTVTSIGAFPYDLSQSEGPAKEAQQGDLSLIVVPKTSPDIGNAEAFGSGYLAMREGALVIHVLDVFFPTLGQAPQIGWNTSAQAGSISDRFFLFSGPDGLPWYQQAGSHLTIGGVNPDGSLQEGALFGGPGLSQPAVIYHTFGAFPEMTMEDGQTDIVPVYRALLNGLSEPMIVPDGFALRTVYAISPPPVQQGLVIGIFESGPPVPNENVALEPDNLTCGTTVFGDQESHSSGWTIATSLGCFFEVKTSSGIPDVATADSSFNLALGVTANFSQTTTSINLTSYTCPSQTVGKPTSINPQGGAIVSVFSFLGCSFQMLGSDKLPVPNAVVVHQLFVTGENTATYAFDYPLDGSGEILPGNIMSYAGRDVKQFGAQALNNLSSASCSWSTAVTAATAVTQISAGSTTIGAYLNFNASIGVKIGGAGDSLAVSGGVAASFSFNYQRASQSQNQLTTNVNLPAFGDPPPAGAYSSYAYEVFILEQDNSHVADLIQLLTKNPTDANTQLLQIISPQSTPWKVVHAVTEELKAGSGIT